MELARTTMLHLLHSENGTHGLLQEPRMLLPSAESRLSRPYVLLQAQFVMLQQLQKDLGRSAAYHRCHQAGLLGHMHRQTPQPMHGGPHHSAHTAEHLRLHDRTPLLRLHLHQRTNGRAAQAKSQDPHPWTLSQPRRPKPALWQRSSPRPHILKPPAQRAPTDNQHERVRHARAAAGAGVVRPQELRREMPHQWSLTVLLLHRLHLGPRDALDHR
jgi:hypothetical protein